MNLRDFGPEVRRYIRTLSKEQLDTLLVNAGVRLHDVGETPEVLRYTCASEGAYRLSSTYRFTSPICTVRVA